MYELKEEFKDKEFIGNNNPVKFILSGEISLIYKKKDKVRKIHNLVLSSDFATIRKIQEKLSKIGNITSDGRPILGFDAKNFLDLILNINENCLVIPAHIWTPWFSVLGSMSGFDSIKECYEDLSRYIFAIETGLSSDPAMNWICSFLDDYAVISNSDAHSPENLGREANIFDTDLTYNGIINALKSNDKNKFLSTIEFFPQEGKYHYDGHRKCNVVIDPINALKNNNICSVCGKKLTLGVMHRVVELSDRTTIDECPNVRPYYSLIQLKELLSEIFNSSPSSKKVDDNYFNLIKMFGSEFDILLNKSLEELKSSGNELLVEGIKRMREGNVIIQEGYDGEYGRIKVFNEDEVSSLKSKDLFFIPIEKKTINKRDKIDFEEFKKIKDNNKKNEAFKENAHTYSDGFSLNNLQYEAVKNISGASIVIAGPGTGKTKTLTYKIVELINAGIKPENILAITFTNNAANEIKDRLKILLKNSRNINEITVSTFHSLGYKIINDFITIGDKTSIIIDDDDKEFIIKQISDLQKTEIKKAVKVISDLKQFIIKNNQADDRFNEIFSCYNAFLTKNNLYDLDDLIYLPVTVLRENKEILDNIRKKYTYLIVDEYQDVNPIQYELIMLISGKVDANITVIGDPNQAIYGFRGSNSMFIKRFLLDFPDAKIFKLEKSYRCSNRILNASSQILNSSFLLNGLEDGINININEFNTEGEEAEFTARKIEQLVGGLRFFSMDSKIVDSGDEGGYALSDIAVLCRTYDLMNPLKKAFIDHSIPCEIISKISIYKKHPFDKIINILKFFINPENKFLMDKALRINGITKDTLKYYNKNKLIDSIKNLIDIYFPDEIKSNPEDFKIFFNEIDNYENNAKAFINSVLLNNTEESFNIKKEAVSIMTMHASKGLEFKCVFIIGCNDKYMPLNLYENQQTDLDEEKRLLYVAMTRAKSNLFISFSKKIKLFGTNINANISPFLKKIKKDLIEYEKIKSDAFKKPKDKQLELF